jgi:hypothetical protein
MDEKDDTRGIQLLWREERVDSDCVCDPSAFRLHAYAELDRH